MHTDIMQKYQDLKQEVTKLSGQLSEITSLAGEELQGYKAEAMDEVSTNVKKAVEVTKNNPWTAVAVVSLSALAIGFLFGHKKSYRN